MIDPFKTQVCREFALLFILLTLFRFMRKFGTRLRCLYIKPMGNFFNLYEFMKILSQYSQHYRANPLRSLNRFDFSFGCRAAFHDSTVNNG
ncbi:hypothetical protein QR98_0103720 [Sarcoptes scabiei]|uniref:Uncharacterized protein n=1 Tax=Sarcoptes scabiei TaxID=52283 RepID=A0A132ALI6_SARSC|nr:hypothetical protein QR98_0103720 [Sarcoptes scabiei]